MERVALNEVELEILKSEIENGGTSVFLTILISMLFSLLFIFSHGKHNTPSLYDNYGFWKPFMIITAILTAIYSFHNQKEKSLIEKDLNSDKKTVEMKTVWKKDRPLMSDKYRIWVDSDIKKFNHFEVNEKEFDAIEKGHKVVLEYAQHSKYLFRLDLKLS
jgi:hypothetical protein